MSRRYRGFALAVCLAGAPLAAQQQYVVGAYGGGYEHLLNLNSAGTADFTAGYSLGVTAGKQFTRYVAAHLDFTYGRNQARGSASFAGLPFERFFYGAHGELSYPFQGPVTPYVFLGGGAVTVREVGGQGLAAVETFTRPAGMLGAGFFYQFVHSPLALMGELKGLYYKWDRGGYDPVYTHMETTGGQIYSQAWNLGQFDRIQWDVTYTAGLSYHF